MMLSGRTCAAAALRAVLRRLPPLPRVASHRVAMGTLLSFSALFLSIYLVQLGSGSLGPLDALSGSVIGFSTEEIGLLGSAHRSEEHTSELQSLMRISYAVFCLKKKNTTTTKRR